MRVTVRCGLVLVAAATFAVGAAVPGPAWADAPGYSVTHVAGLPGAAAQVASIAVSPDGRTGYVTGQTHQTAVVDIASRRVIASIADPAAGAVQVGVAYNAAGTAVYVANRDGTFTVLNPATRTLSGRFGAANQSADATGIAVRGNLGYVPERGLGVLAVVDLVAKRVVRTVSVPTTRLDGVVLAPNGTAGYVWGSTGVSRIDLTTWAVTSVASGWTRSVGVAPDGATVYLAQQPGLVAIQVTGGTVVYSNTVAAQSAVAVSPDGRYVYYGAGGQYDPGLHDASNDAVYRIDTTSWSMDEFDVPHDLVLGSDKLNLYSTHGALRVTPDGASLLFADGSGGVASAFRSGATVSFLGWVSGLGYLGAASGPVAAMPVSGTIAYLPTSGGSEPYTGIDIFDPATRSVTGMIPVRYGVRSVAVSRDGHKALATGPAGVSVVDPAAKAVVKTLSVTGASGPIVFAPDGRRAYVANSGSAVTVLDTSTSPAAFSVINTLTLPVAPTGVSVSPDGRYLYAVGGSRVMKVTLATGAVRSVDLASSTGPALAMSPSGGTLYVTTSGGRYGRAVVALAAAGPTVSTSISFGTARQPWAIVGSPDGRIYTTVYVQGASTVELARIDPVAHSWTTVVSGSWIAGQPAISPNGRTLYAYGGADPHYGNSLVVVTLAAHLTPTSTPTIVGTAKVGHTLTAKPGTWGPAPVTLRYQWFASGHAIVGATHATLKLAAAQAGKAVTVRVTGSKTGYDTVVRISGKTTAVAKGTLTVHTPTLSGITKAGHTLTAKPGVWGPAPVSLRYQWFASGHPVSGATHPTLKLTSPQVGKKLTVRVTGSRAGYTTVARTSKASATVGR